MRFALAFLLVLSTVVGAAQNSPPPRDRAKQQQSTDNKAARADDVSKVTAGVTENQPSPTQKEQNAQEESQCILKKAFAPDTWANWALFIAAIWAGITALNTLKEMHASTVVSEKTLVLTQRPRIVVRAFYFSEMRGVGAIARVPNRIEAGSFCTGQYYIQNCGGTDARIREIYSEVFIADKLPMKRPYEGKEGSKEEKTLRPGTSTFYLFGRMEPLDSATHDSLTQHFAGGADKNFYVLGWIGYTDDLGIYRIIAFCRRYDAMADRFVPVNDPDYEYAD